MASRTINLTMDQGADFTYGTKIYDSPSSITALSLDTTNDFANASMWKTQYHTNATATFGVYLSSETSKLVIHLDAANTAAIAPGRYVYDVKYTEHNGDAFVSADWTDNATFQAIEGIITVNPGVTT